MANRYSIFSLLKESLRGHRGWAPAWRDPEPKPAYDFIVVGGGGHGLATAYYLAKNHNARNVAVLEKGYIGGGNVGRNTTIVRSNYLMPGNIPFYEHSLKLWEGLEQDINYNAMISQRGVLNLFHNDSQRDACVRRGNAMHLHGVDGELLNREQVRKLLPMADFDNARFPIMGGLMQRRGGTVRHDAVAWGFARAADSLGVDILWLMPVQPIGVQSRERELGRQVTENDLEPLILRRYLADKDNSAALLFEAMLTVEKITRQMALLQERYDVLLSPTLTKPPVEIGKLSLNQDNAAYEAEAISVSAFPSLYNATGQPAQRCVQRGGFA